MALIYCVEDDESIRELVLYALKGGGYQPRGFEQGDEFFKALQEETPQLVLLDIMLPGEDGIKILQKLREEPAYRSILVMMLTAKTSEYDKVRGLDLGADDYMTKPFSVMELLSRVRALLRRTGNLETHEAVLCCGQVILDYQRRTVTAAGVPCELTYKEFELLHYLMKNRGMVLTRDRIMETVWGFDFEGESRTVDMHIKTLRQKLERCGVKNLIVTVRSVGYKIDA